MDVRVGLWSKLSAEELMLLNCGVGEDLRVSNQSILKEISPGISLEGLMVKLKLQYFGHLMRRCHWWLFQSHWKRLWCWEGLGAGGEGDDRGWDGWMASQTRWTWVWVNSGSWWWTRRPGMLRFMGSQRVGPDWAAELNWRKIQIHKVKKEIEVVRSFHTDYHHQSSSSHYCWACISLINTQWGREQDKLDASTAEAA